MPQRKRWHDKGLPAMEFWRRRLSVHLQREVITARRPDHSTRAASGRRRAVRREAVARRKAEQHVEQQDSAVQRGGRAPADGLVTKGHAETAQRRKASCCALSAQRVEHRASATRSSSRRSRSSTLGARSKCSTRRPRSQAKPSGTNVERVGEAQQTQSDVARRGSGVNCSGGARHPARHEDRARSCTT
jgi:hypothetical protein